MSSVAPKLEIGKPRLFTARALLIVHAFNILLVIPVFISMLAVSLMRLSILTLLVPILTLVGTAYFLPFGLGNAYISRRVRSMKASPAADQESYIVQLKATPRVCSGLRAM